MQVAIQDHHNHRDIRTCCVAETVKQINGCFFFFERTNKWMLDTYFLLLLLNHPFTLKKEYKKE